MARQEIENVVFQGGGVRGIAYTGAVEMLHKYDILKDIKRVAGTSAGAIPALVMALRYDLESVKGIIQSMDFKLMEDHFNPLRVLTHYGLYKGDFLLGWLKSLVKASGLHEDATFQDLEDFGCRQMHVFASDLNSKSIAEFSLNTTPNVSVAEAVRASMSIPMFFEAWQFPNKEPNDHFYVDGGMVFNYPLTIFDVGRDINYKTLGFHIENLNAPHTQAKLEKDEIITYIKTVFEMLMHSQVLDFLEDETQLARTVRIDDLGISATDFGVTKEQQMGLYQSGLKYTEAFLVENLGYNKLP